MKKTTQIMSGFFIIFVIFEDGRSVHQQDHISFDLFHYQRICPRYQFFLFYTSY